MVVAAALVRFHTATFTTQSPSLDKFPITQPAGWPVSLPFVYLAWMTAVIALYPVCAWYARVKSRDRSGWLSYL
jgi:hypothetical protein